MKKAIVTGGTGFLGRHLVSMLSESGWNVIVFARNIYSKEAKDSDRVVFRSVDIACKDSLNKVFESVDVVFHCAALSSAWGDYDSFYSANVEGTRNILTCCDRFKVKKLIYVSSTSVYFKYRDEIGIVENQRVGPSFANSYAETKYLGEQVLINEKKNVEVTIVRPRGIVGEGDAAIMPRIMRVARKGWFPLIKGGEATVDVTYVKNVAYALILCAETQDIDKEIFNISNDQPVKVKDLLKLVLRGRSIKFIKVPYKLAFFFARISEVVAKVLKRGEPRLTVYGVGLLAHTQVLNVDKAKAILGYSPKYSIEYAVRQYLAWEKERAGNI
ncbi:NAD-dependent epimerase/dehydratase family protein [Microbulbifer sp. CNSA002]|uniref:NAD-dependent epimerase/dehydratase family protein n=1 Tax=Microbulbifer sp. CNSA002 TaxID=3373604 RepID=UPI0039B485A5